jgi:hypothetical protein
VRPLECRESCRCHLGMLISMYSYKRYE